ncbi:MAG: T9SS type A sorting domain-containing protein [Bacteroidetes bacterium]|nr:T9SS type A sorting domain-containing protein [Bacteroidota bacterium]
MKKLLLVVVLFVCTSYSYSVPKKFLFDATMGETAGNADWVIDEDTSTPQRYPTPLQSTVTQSTTEDYWKGAISAWGISLVKLGNTVETLPPSGAITYGNSSNAQDLSNYDVFVIDEPNNAFTATEKAAIIHFVQNGGGLFLVADHAGADRDGDGWDAVRAINDLIRNNSVQSYPFGIILDSNNISETSVNVLTSWSGSPILNGSVGAVQQLKFSNGTSMTINTTQNANAKGVIWRNGASQNSVSIMCATSLLGTGRVCIIGDSSPCDDGTGASGNTLYPGWTELGTNHSSLFLNASLWLAKLSGVTSVGENTAPVSFKLEQNYPNPFNPTTKINFSIPKSEYVTLTIYNSMGKEINTLVSENISAGNYEYTFSGMELSSGVYFYKITTPDFTQTKSMTLIK